LLAAAGVLDDALLAAADAGEALAPPAFGAFPRPAAPPRGAGTEQSRAALGAYLGRTSGVSPWPVLGSPYGAVSGRSRGASRAHLGHIL
jgi:hypothetical protein